MRIQDLLIESKQDITEAPVGLLKKAGLGIKKVFGSGKAAGELETGNVANQLKKEYMMMLGKTGQEPDATSVISFLKTKGYPTTSAGSALGVAATPKVKQAKQAVTTKPGATKAAPVVKKATAADPADAMTDIEDADIAKSTASWDDAKLTRAISNPAVNPRVKAASKAELAKRSGGKQQQLAPNAPNKDAGAAAFGQMAKQLSTPAEKPAVTPTKPAVAPTVDASGRPQGGGKVAGVQSQSPDAIRKRQSRAVKKRTTHPADDNPNIQLGAESIDYNISEAITDQQMDVAFLKAAQEKAQQGATAPAATTGAAPTAPAKPGIGAMAKAMAAPRDDGSVGGGGTADVMSGLNVTTLKSAIARAINQKPLTSQETASLQRLLKNLSKEG